MRVYIKRACIFLLLILSLSILPDIPSLADKGKWGDDGLYDTAWLGDYANTSDYIISDSMQLAAFMNATSGGLTFENKTIRLSANVDMSANWWTMAYSYGNYFMGTFDGNGYTISGLQTVPASGSAAFMFNNSGMIMNTLFHVGICSDESASVAVHNYGTIQNVGVIGNIGTESSSMCGGIVCINGGKIENCYSGIDILCADSGIMGGITAKNTGILNQCFWSMPNKVSSDKKGTISNCEKISDKSSIDANLNTLAYSNGWLTWTDDTQGVFAGYPVMILKSEGDSTVPVSGISFPFREKQMYVGEELILEPTFYPADASNKSIVWLTTNESVATVDENGKVCAVGTGYATIRATTQNGNKVANCFINVLADKNVVISSSIKLDNVEYRIPIDKTAQIRYTVYPENATVRSAVFKVLDEGVVRCSDSGVLTPVSAGSTVVTVTAADGGCSVSALVTVIEDNYSGIWDGTVASSYAGGDGTKSNPFIIENGSHLAKLAKEVNNGNSYEGVYFVQRISIMLNNTTVDEWTTKLTAINNWVPIGVSSDKIFRGNYDGGGFYINGLYVDSSYAASGLFGYAQGGNITNISIIDSVIRGNEFCGGIVGFNASYVYACEVAFSVDVTGIKHIGAIAGYNARTVDRCINSGDVEGIENVGGIVGYSDNVLMNCSNFGKVVGSTNTGGVCGKSSYNIENCLNTATVFGNKNCGGIAGYCELDVANCHSTRFPEATEQVGMIVGSAKRPVSSYSLNSYAACGNIANRDEYLLAISSDGVYSTVIGGYDYISVLNQHAGCISSDNYYEWQKNESGDIVLSSQYKTHNKIVDGESGIKLSGSYIDPEMKFSFCVLESSSIADFLSKVNYNKLFQSSNVLSEDILFIREVSADKNIGFSYSLSLPFSVDLGSDSLVFDSFSHTAFLNYSDNTVYVYVPEYLNKAPDGNYVGALKCMYHTFEGDTVVKNGEFSSRYTFIYDGSSLSFSSDAIGIWAIADIRENEQILPIETGTADITLPQVSDEEEHFDFGIFFTVVVFVLLSFAALAVIVIQRSKNNILISGKDEQ